MDPDSDRDLFEAWRRRGDVAALARVFDRTAPDLLRLALHLSGRPDQAEDLVQATFLTAIEDAGRFDARRPLFPWLCGILTNRVRELRRERQRTLDPERLAPEPFADPVTAAQAAEAHAAVERALLALPETYRPTLTLYLQYGLKSAEIAGVLAVPPGTVRSQLARGLELLRRALPAGAGLALGVALLPGRGLAAVRAAVLAAATPGATATALSVPLWSAVLTMSKSVIAIVLCVGVGAGWWWWSRAAAPASTRPAAVAGTAPFPEAGAEAARALRPLAEPRSRRTEVRAAALPAGEVRVAVLWAEDDTPAAGIHLRLRGDPRAASLTDQEARSDAQGQACFAGVGPGAVRVVADRGAVAGGQLDPAVGLALVLRIAAGVRVVGRVVGKDQGPVGGAQLWLLPPGEADAMPGPALDPGGGFVLRAAQPGLGLFAVAPVLRPSLLARVDAAAGAEQTIELRLDVPGGSVAGRVVDASHRGIAGASVRAGFTPDLDPRFRARAAPGVLAVRADRDGRFALHGLIPGVPLPMYAGAAGFAPWCGSVIVAAEGASELTVRLTRGGFVSGTARDQDGRPLAAVLVAAGSGSGDAPAWAWPNQHTGADGRFHLGPVAAGPVEMYAQDRGGTVHTATIQVADGEQAEWHPEFGGGARIHGRLLDAQGQPLAGWRIGDRDLDRGFASRFATVGADGRFWFGDCAPGGHRLEVHEPGTPGTTPVLITDPVRPDQDELVLRVPDQARSASRLAGRVLDPQGQPTAAVRGGLTQHDSIVLHPLRVGADGRFRSALLPPGRYRLRLEPAAGVPRTLELELGPRQELDLGDLALSPWGTLGGTLHWRDGPPVAEARIAVVPEDAELAPVPCGLPRPGQLQGLPLAVGRWRITAWSEASAPLSVPVEIQAGQDARVALILERGAPRRLVLQGDALRGAVTLRWSQGGREFLREPLGQGETTVTRAFLPGTYRVDVSAEGGATGAAEFEVAASGPVAEIPVRLR